MAWATAVVVRAARLRQQVFEFGKHLFNRIEIRRIFRQEEQLGAGGTDSGADIGALVALKVVEDDHVAGTQGGCENLLDVSQEGTGTDRAIEQPGRLDAIVPQGGYKRHGVPMPVGDFGAQPPSPWCPAA